MRARECSSLGSTAATHSGCKIRPGKYSSREAEIAAIEKNSSDVLQRNYSLEFKVRKQKDVIYGLERDKIVLQDKMDGFKELVTLLKSRISLLEASVEETDPLIYSYEIATNAKENSKSK